MPIYEILEAIMLEQNLTIPQVARAAGLSDSTVRGILVRRQKNIALEVAFKLSRGLGVPIEVLNGEVPPYQKTPPAVAEGAKGDVLSMLPSLTEEELKDLLDYARFLISKRESQPK